MTTVQRAAVSSQETTLRFLLMGRFVGAREIEVMLGVSRQRVQQLVKRPDFPKPVETLAMGSIWRRSDVVKWAKATGRM